MRIVPMAKPYVSDVAHVHERAFPGFFLTSLGSGFLRAFYRHYCRESTAISFVALSDADRVVGFIVGSMGSQGFFRRLLWREFLPLALGAVVAAARNPRHVL